MRNQMKIKSGNNLLNRECWLRHCLWRPRPTGPGTFLSLALLVFLVLSANPVFAKNRYVDKNNSTCSNTGPGSQTTPYCSIGAANLKAVAGDTVIVASGNYPERVSVANSGTASAPIVFTVAGGASVTVGNGQANGFYVSSKSWITISGFTISGTSSYGIGIVSSNNITLSGNHVTKAGQPISGATSKGIYLSNSSDSQVSGNLVDYNTNSGIYLTNGTTGVRVVGNVAAYNAAGYARIAPGIDVRSSGNTIEANVCHNNEDSGIQSYTGASHTLILNNLSYNNGDHGIDNYNSPFQTIIGNTVFNNVTAGINVEGQSPGATLANNITVDNGIESPRTTGNIRIDSTSIQGATVDYDLVYLSQPSTMIVWGSTFYNTLASFTRATGMEANGIQGNPLFANPVGADFHLTEGSPAIDSANSGASGALAHDIQFKARVDDPLTPNSGVGPRTYDDRGAYEYQPN